MKRQFTAREFRELFVWTVKHWRARPRQLYPDNGRQYAAEVLGPFMAYLTVPGEPPTKLPHPPPGDPRGRGLTEDLLGDIDSFLRTRPAYFEKGTDGDFSYRAVLQRIDEGTVVPRTFEDLAQDIKGHLDIVNSESEDGPTRFDLMNQGVSYGLSVPSDPQLFLFARRVESKKVKVQPYGIDYRKEQWEPERIDDPAVRAQWHQAGLSSVGRQMISASLGSELLVYVNLAGDGITYEPFVKKGKPRLSEYAQKRANRAREGEVIAAHRTSNEVVEALLEERLGQPLTLDGSRKRAIPAPRDGAAQDDLSGGAPPNGGVADWAHPGDRADMHPGNETSQKPPDQPQLLPPDEDDDWNFFTGFAPKK